MLKARDIALTLALIAVSAPGAAEQERDGKKKVQVTPPPPPEELKKGEGIDPQVTIVDRDWARIREYSVNGQVYAVRVEPKVGFPYWLYDSNGDGRLESRFETAGGVPDTHQWRLLEW
jgi:hypothetical protein